MADKIGTSTQAVHAGVVRDKAAQQHAITTPIVQSATYAFKNTADLQGFIEQKLHHGEKDGRDEYARYGNPTVFAVERKLAALEGGEEALLYASGMAAITSLLLSSLPTATHVIMTDNSYRRTRQFCELYLKRLGIETSVVPVGDYDALESSIIPKKTRFIISESPTNPHLRLADFERVAALGKQYKARTLIDSTLGTPVNQCPLEYGIDFVLHSATKYLGGHHDLLAGVIVGNAVRMGALRDAQGVLGGVIAPQVAFLLERGLRTLALRVNRQNENALQIAQFLENHAKVKQVWYPGLPSHPDHDLALKQMRGHGGVVSFEVDGNFEATGRFIDSMRIPYIAASLGGVESLIEQPALMSHFDTAPQERAAMGITDGLVRFAAGIEDADDLIADFEQALANL